MTIDDRQYHLKGRLVAFVGYTPAVNMVGGFKEGVGLAMRKCRQCMATLQRLYQLGFPLGWSCLINIYSVLFSLPHCVTI